MTEELGTAEIHIAWGPTVTRTKRRARRSKLDRAVWVVGFVVVVLVAFVALSVALVALRDAVGDGPVNIAFFVALLGYVGLTAWKESDR